MHKVVSYYLSFILAMFSGLVLADGPQVFELKPGVPLRLTSTLPQPLKVACEIRLVSTTAIHNVQIRVLNGTGVINGTSLKRGQSLILTVKDLQIISIVANPGSDAEFVNVGPYPIKASCV